MALGAAVLPALFRLPTGWGIAAIAAGLAVEVGEVWFWWKLSHRRRPAVGAEALVGRRATVVAACRPVGTVRVDGELWRAHCRDGADPSDEVTIAGIEALTLHVERR